MASSTPKLNIAASMQNLNVEPSSKNLHVASSTPRIKNSFKETKPFDLKTIQ